MSRRRYTDEEKARLLAEFQACGSTAAFCREHGLCYQTFLNWRRAAPGDEAFPERPEFIELDLGRPVRAAPAVLIELELGDGIVLRVRRDPAPQP